MQIGKSVKRRRRQLSRDYVRWQRARLARSEGLKESHNSCRLFVTGVQRSGTNMVMRVLENHPCIEVYHETDRRAFQHYEMRGDAEIRRLIDKSPFPIVTIKALLEGHDLLRLMETFAPARCIWMFRHFDDVVNSSLHNWPGFRNKIEGLVQDRQFGEWRSRGMSDETYATVKSLYGDGLDDASANALFWFYRNQLFFDQALDQHPDALLMSYEWLVQNVPAACSLLSQWVGLPTDPLMGSMINSKSVRKNPAPDIEANVRDACESMMDKLNEVWAGQEIQGVLNTLPSEVASPV